MRGERRGGDIDRNVSMIQILDVRVPRGWDFNGGPG